MSDAFAGVGTTFERGDSASNETFTAIAEVNSIDGPNISLDTIDVTNLDSSGGYREFIAGFIDGGEVSLEMNFTLDGYDDVLADVNSRTKRNYRIVLPDANSTTFNFLAFASGVGLGIPTDDKVTATATYKISGAVSLVS